MATREVDSLLASIGVKGLTSSQEVYLDIVLGKAESPQSKLVKHLARMKTQNSEQATCCSQIFSNVSELGLVDNPEFQKFFFTLSEETAVSTNARFARLNR